YKTSIQFIERVKELLSRMKKTFPHQHFEVPLIASNPYEYIQEKNFWMCPAGATVGVVDIDGHIVPCNQFIDTSIKSCSTIHTDRFQKIWMNDNMLSRFRYKLDQESAVTTCDECKYLVLKNGKEIK
ncbi:MAG: SPASM domain-containing protein, partial [Candidatus Thermoplasmatota archaeon]|nr:SPASM domain-containing protein [Candidatus Thermoplasmatota archaeon]